ncbi:M23 family metallopeptidase [bacterium]|nr:M23 family metallopeptidase [bacterium]
MRTIATALTLAVLCALVRAEQAPKPWRFVGETTYEQRVSAHPARRPVEADSLIVPHAHAANVLPAPKVAEAGARPLPAHYPVPEQVVWRVVPLVPAHREYLAKRAEFLADKDDLGLVAWCERHKLPVCAEFELRRLLRPFRSFRDRGYQPLNTRWVKHGWRHLPPYSFPLPFSGTWYVVEDRTGHHRIKAGAAFAFDFVIRKRNRQFSGTGRQLADHHAWDQPILAQADGVVVTVEDGRPDMPIGRSGGFNSANVVVVDYGGGIQALYAHNRKGSAKVKRGDRVSAGQELARVGNSGASGAPHIHFTFLDAGAFSVRGRFRHEVLLDRKWVALDGGSLKEGLYVRNPAAGGPKPPVRK